MQSAKWRFMALAFAVNLLFIGVTVLSSSVQGQPTYTLADSASYYGPGLRLATDDIFSSQVAAPHYWEDARTPGYPLLIAFTAQLFGLDKFHWLLFLSPICAALLVFACLQLTTLLQLDAHWRQVAWVAILFPNALGFSGLLITEYLGGVFAITALMLTLLALQNADWRLAVIAATVWAGCQFIRPTFAYILLFFCIAGLVLVRQRAQARVLVLLGVLSLIVPGLLAIRMHQTHGIYTVSTIGAHTTREYLLTKAEANVTGADYLTLRDQIQAQIETQALAIAADTGVTLENARYGLVTQQTRAVLSTIGIVPIARVYVEELVRQLLAPWDFWYWPLFGSAPPTSIRLALVPVALAFYAAAGIGLFKLPSRQAQWIGVLLWIYFYFWLTTGALSTGVGSRLKFPGDLALIPLAVAGFMHLNGLIASRK